MPRARLGLRAAAAMLLCAAPARADDAIGDSMGPRALGLGEALRAAAAGSSSINLNPAGVALTRTVAPVLEGTYGFRDDASVLGVSICDSSAPRAAACLYYNHFEASPDGGERALHEVGLTTAIPLAQKLLVGVTTKYVDYTESGSFAQPMDDSRDGDFLLDGGVIVRAGDRLNLALVGYNLVGHDAGAFPRAVGTGLALHVTPNLMLAGDARWNTELEDSTPGRYSAGAEFFLASPGAQAGYPFRAGYVYDEASQAQYVAGGLGYVTGRVALDVGLRKQVDEGDEMMLQFGLRLFMPPR